MSVKRDKVIVCSVYAGRSRELIYGFEIDDESAEVAVVLSDHHVLNESAATSLIRERGVSFEVAEVDGDIAVRVPAEFDGGVDVKVDGRARLCAVKGGNGGVESDVRRKFFGIFNAFGSFDRLGGGGNNEIGDLEIQCHKRGIRAFGQSDVVIVMETETLEGAVLADGDSDGDRRIIRGILGNLGVGVGDLVIGQSEQDGSDGVDDVFKSGKIDTFATCTEITEQGADFGKVQSGFVNGVAVNGRFGGGNKLGSHCSRHGDKTAERGIADKALAREISESALSERIVLDLHSVQIGDRGVHVGNEAAFAGQEAADDRGAFRQFGNVQLTELGPFILGVGQTLSEINDLLVLACGFRKQRHVIALFAAYGDFNESPVLAGGVLADAGFEVQRDVEFELLLALADDNAEFETRAYVSFILDRSQFSDKAVRAAYHRGQGFGKVAGSLIIRFFFYRRLFVVVIFVFIVIAGKSRKGQNAHQ